MHCYSLAVLLKEADESRRPKRACLPASSHNTLWANLNTTGSSGRPKKDDVASAAPHSYPKRVLLYRGTQVLPEAIAGEGITDESPASLR